MTTVKGHPKISKKGKFFNVRQHTRKQGFYGNKWLLTPGQWDELKKKKSPTAKDSQESWREEFGKYPVHRVPDGKQEEISKLIDYAKKLGFGRVWTDDDGSFTAEDRGQFASGITVRKDYLYDSLIPDISVSWQSGGGDFKQISKTIIMMENARKLYKKLGGK